MIDFSITVPIGASSKVYIEVFVREVINSLARATVLMPPHKGFMNPDWFVFTQVTDFIGNPDFIGRFENLESDVKSICKKLNVDYKDFPYENKTNRTKYTDYYDNETANIVYNLFKKDIESLNYKYGD